jgi:hypothetical protein
LRKKFAPGKKKRSKLAGPADLIEGKIGKRRLIWRYLRLDVVSVSELYSRQEKPWDFKELSRIN